MKYPNQPLGDDLPGRAGPEAKDHGLKGGLKPTHFLHAKSGDRTQRVGSAWLKEDGRISITLDRFVVLDAKDDFILSLFPRNEQDDRHGR